MCIYKLCEIKAQFVRSKKTLFVTAENIPKKSQKASYALT